MQLFALFFSLFLGFCKASIKTVPCPNCILQLFGQLGLVLLKITHCFLNLGPRMSLGLGLIAGLLNPFLGHVNLLGNLHNKVDYFLV